MSGENIHLATPDYLILQREVLLERGPSADSRLRDALSLSMDAHTVAIALTGESLQSVDYLLRSMFPPRHLCSFFPSPA